MLSGLLAKIGAELDRSGIRYMVIGGQAVLVFGEPRLTRDIDITLDADIDRLPEVVAAVERLGLRPLVSPAEFVAETMVLPCEDGASGVRVDLVFSNTPFEREAMGRTRSMPIEGVQVRFASPEDLVILKVIAGRPRDLEDVKSVLVKQPELDRSLVRRWLERYQAQLAVPLIERFESVARDIDRKD